jgi:nitrate reductase NapE component
MKKKQRKILTAEEKEKERIKVVVFSFVICIVGTYGYLIDIYDGGGPLIPNPINLLAGKVIIPDEAPMFIGDYYIANQNMLPIKVYYTVFGGEGRNVVAYDISHQNENKVSGVFFYMILCFLPLFIIGLVGKKVEKINKKKIIEFFYNFTSK